MQPVATPGLNNLAGLASRTTVAEPGLESIPGVKDLARQLYTQGSYVMRLMMHYRVHICPFDRLLRLVPPGSSVLDIACGGGLFIALLAASGRAAKAVGFDASRPAIAIAEAMKGRLNCIAPQAKVRFDLLNCDDRWPDGQFDVVTMIDLMHHVPVNEQHIVFDRAVDAVRPGGLFLYKDLSDRPFLAAVWNRLHDLLVARRWIHYVPMKTVERWATSRQLSTVHAGACTRLVYYHEFRLFRKPRFSTTPVEAA